MLYCLFNLNGVFWDDYCMWFSISTWVSKLQRKIKLIFAAKLWEFLASRAIFNTREIWYSDQNVISERQGWPKCVSLPEKCLKRFKRLKHFFFVLGTTKNHQFFYLQEIEFKL